MSATNVNPNLTALWRDEHGFVISAELVIVSTVLVLGLIVGMTCLQTAVVAEFQDIGAAIRGLNQSYTTPSFRGCWKWWGRTSWTSGSSYIDRSLVCLNGDCYANADIVGGGGYVAPQPYVTPQPTVIEPRVVPAPATPTCTTCPPIEPMAPATPIPEPCQECQPSPSAPLPTAPRPEIPQGPAPQNLPSV